MFISPGYISSSLGISKIFVLIGSVATFVLSGMTRPTSLQVEIVDSTWKEDGLYYLSITTIISTICSILSCIIFINTIGQRKSIYKDFLQFGIGCILFLVFGIATLESALNIFIRISDCCEDANNVSENTCDLPGFLQEAIISFSVTKNMKDSLNEIRQTKFPFSLLQGTTFPDLPECAKEFDLNSWTCTVCVNELVQPNFTTKGAAGAAGLITAIANFIVVFVGVRILRNRKSSKEKQNGNSKK